ncbi:Bug family tripartite tricarboxylate transporter substrate binding protein [Methylibium rhizosphaerae]|uniref:Bug family tripartite tricarboxylate transporter substrate binding protein n=1 Tax=Methylibium rhizosphaerae TaxID=2570323 RepID=UPI00112C5746|nr:tripartite tricarboxylate transporter substrate-binding protein [Methylibium rhizosphaerae]
MQQRRSWITTTLAAWLAAGLCGAAAAQSDYPSKPITLVVGYPPGGSVDLVARTLAPELARRLGQAVVIENIGGAGGTIGAQRVAKAAPDGYKLLLASNNEMAISKLVNPALAYDGQRDFSPIGLVATQPMVLVAAPHTKVRSLDDFVRVVKGSPGKFSYGSSGMGTALHLAGEMLKQSGGLFMVHIPYRGVGPLTTDLLGGQLDFGVFVLSSGLPHIRAGSVAALGTTDARRAPATPDIPALSEHPSFRKVNIGIWFGLFAPARLPQPVAARLGQAFQEAVASPELRRKLEEAGARPAPPEGKPDEQLATYLKAEQEKYARIVDFAKIRNE